jgi:hypothetical protein
MKMPKLDSEKIKEIAINRPYVIEIMQLQILYDLASMLEEVLTTLKEGIPEGKVMEWKQEITSEKPFYMDIYSYFHKPLLSVTIINEGDYDVRAIITTQATTREVVISSGAIETIALRKEKIESITFYMVEKGTSSVIRILGVY